MADVFISYSRKDKDFVHRLDKSLSGRGREAWVDWEGIRPTEEFMQAIYRAIEAADTFIFVLTPDSVASEVCGREIRHAEAHNKRMVPIVARDTDASTVPEALAKLNWIFCRDNDDLEKATDTLISALDTDLDWVHAHTRLLTRAIEWEAKAKNNSFVLRGVDLRAAEQWLAQAGINKERQPTALQTEYIIASRKAAARRQRFTLGMVTFGFVVAVVLAVLAFRQSQLARAKELEVRKTFSRSDFFRADELVSGQKRQEALAFLARAVRSDQDNHAAGQRISFLLMQHPWFVPETNAPPPVEEPSPSSPAPVKLMTAAMSKIKAALVQSNHEVAGDDSTKDPEARADESSKKAVFSPGGERAAIRFGRRIYVFDVATGDELASQEDAIGSTVRFSPDGSRLVVVGGTTYELGNVGEVYINALDGSAPKEFHFTNVIHSPEFSPDGQYFVTVCLDRTAQLWKINGDRLATFPVTEAAASNWPGPGEDRQGPGKVCTVHFSPDGRRLTIGETSWVLVGRQPVFKLKGDDTDDMANLLPRPQVGRFVRYGVLAESLDGQLTATAPLPEEKKPIEIAHVENQKGLILPGSEGSDFAGFTPDGSRLVALSAGRGGVWDTRIGVLVGSFQFTTDGNVHLGAVTANQFVVLTGTKAQVWDLVSCKPIGPALEHHGEVYSAEFHPDGRRLVTATKDKTARDLGHTEWQGLDGPRKAHRERQPRVLCAGRRFFCHRVGKWWEWQRRGSDFGERYWPASVRTD